MKKCKECNDCNDDIVQIGFPTNTPQNCDEPEICSEIVPASCVVTQQVLLCGESSPIPEGTRLDVAISMLCEAIQSTTGLARYKFVHDITTPFGGDTVVITAEDLWSCTPNPNFCQVQSITASTPDMTIDLWHFVGSLKHRLTNSQDVLIVLDASGGLRITFNQPVTTSQVVRLVVIA